MFEINKSREDNTDIPIITHNRVNLLKDDLPILFFGNNKYGDYILGSIICDSVDDNIVRYIHVLLESNEFYKYLSKHKSYRDIIKESKGIYIVDEYYNSKNTNYYKICFNELPNDYIPLEQTYCPEIIHMKIKNLYTDLTIVNNENDIKLCGIIFNSKYNVYRDDNTIYIEQSQTKINEEDHNER